MEIKTKKHFNSLIKSLAEEILDEEDLDETTVTGNVVGYNTPFAFTGGKKKKKKYKDNTYRDKIGITHPNHTSNSFRYTYKKSFCWASFCRTYSRYNNYTALRDNYQTRVQYTGQAFRYSCRALGFTS